MLPSDDSILFTYFTKKLVIHSNFYNKVKESTH